MSVNTCSSRGDARIAALERRKHTEKLDSPLELEGAYSGPRQHARREHRPRFSPFKFGCVDTRDLFASSKRRGAAVTDE